MEFIKWQLKTRKKYQNKMPNFFRKDNNPAKLDYESLLLVFKKDITK
jgi:hypothetical protein